MLDPSIAVAHAARAYVHEGHWRGADALAEYELALETSPNDPAVLRLYAALKRNTRYFDEAIEIGRRVVELDPLTTS